MQIRVPISVGELLDKVSILRIKSRRIEDRAKLPNVRRELEALEPELERIGASSSQLELWLHQLGAVNERLWEVEDEIRAHEARRDFGEEFVRLARSVYRTNDERAHIKREINVATGSELVEEKSYADPGPSTD